jgi:hypothetical protein
MRPDAETRGRGDTETRGHGDAGTRRHGDAGTRGDGDGRRVFGLPSFRGWVRCRSRRLLPLREPREYTLPIIAT